MPVHTVFVVDSVYFLFRSLVSWRNQETNHTGKDFGIIKVDFSKNAPLGKMVDFAPWDGTHFPYEISWPYNHP